MPRKKLFEDDPNWTFETVVLPKESKFYNRYFYRRNRAHRVVLDTPKANAFAAYTLIEKDLRNCKIWLNSVITLASQDELHVNATKNIVNLENREIFNTIKGLFVAALTIYGKCFTSCEGRRVKLEKVNLGEEFHETHEEAMSYRNNFAAHSGAKKIEYSKIIILLDPKKNRGNLPRMCTELLQPDSWSIKQIEKFIELVEHARVFCKNKQEILSNKVLEEYVLKKGKSYRYGKV